MANAKTVTQTPLCVELQADEMYGKIIKSSHM